MLSFGHKISFCHNLNQASNQKSSLTKVLKLNNLQEDIDEKVNIMQTFGHKSSFYHNLNKAFNENSSLTKVVKVTSIRKDME